MTNAHQTELTLDTKSQRLDKQRFKRFSVPTAMYDRDWATPSVIHIYSYMLNRYMFFKHNNMQYFESEAQIGSFLNTTTKTVQRSIKVLKEHNFLDYELKHKQSSFSNVYTVNDVFGIYDDVFGIYDDVGLSKGKQGRHDGQQHNDNQDDVPDWMREPMFWLP